MVKNLTFKDKQNRLYNYCASNDNCNNCIFEKNDCVDFLKPDFDIKVINKFYLELDKIKKEERLFRKVYDLPLTQELKEW